MRRTGLGQRRRRELPATGADGERVNGYRVVTIDGDAIGKVASRDGETTVIRSGRWPFSMLSLVPSASTFVRDADRTLLLLAPFDGLTRVGALRR